jgi:hypothetical protein
VLRERRSFHGEVVNGGPQSGEKQCTRAGSGSGRVDTRPFP